MPGSAQDVAEGTSARRAVALAIVESIVKLIVYMKESVSTADSALKHFKSECNDIKYEKKKL